MRSFDDISWVDMVFTSTKVMEVEAAVRTPLEASSWIDWWLSAAKLLVIRTLMEESKCHRFFLTICQDPDVDGQDRFGAVGELCP